MPRTTTVRNNNQDRNSRGSDEENRAPLAEENGMPPARAPLAELSLLHLENTGRRLRLSRSDSTWLRITKESYNSSRQRRVQQRGLSQTRRSGPRMQGTSEGLSAGEALDEPEGVVGGAIDADATLVDGVGVSLSDDTLDSNSSDEELVTLKTHYHYWSVRTDTIDGGPALVLPVVYDPSPEAKQEWRHYAGHSVEIGKSTRRKLAENNLRCSAVVLGIDNRYHERVKRWREGLDVLIPGEDSNYFRILRRDRDRTRRYTIRQAKHDIQDYEELDADIGKVESWRRILLQLDQEQGGEASEGGQVAAGPSNNTRSRTRKRVLETEGPLEIE
ncbi:hypothetical protein BGX27_004462, partial [Mortierella sp. AM989]